LFIVSQKECFFIGGKGALSLGIQHSVACDASLLGSLPELPGMAAAASSLSFGEKRAQERKRAAVLFSSLGT